MIKSILKKFLIIFIMIFFLINTINMPIYAAHKSTGSSAIGVYNKEIKSVNTSAGTPTETVSNIIGSIIFIMQTILLGLALIMLIVLGIKFIVGSVEEKAEIKKHLTIYVFGVILLIAAAGFVSLLKKFFLAL